MTENLYHSIFKDEFRELVDIKKSLGFAYDTQAAAFRRIDEFLVKNELKVKSLSKELCNDWCRKRDYESVNNQAHRVSTMRVFCRYLTDIGLEAYIPPKGITPKPPRYDAHIYSDDELKRFFAEVDKSQSVPGGCPYRSLVMPVFFRILYTSGMRVSELRLARIRDINLDKKYITARNAKNNKERIVPVHPKLIERCRSLKEKIHAASSEDEYFFMIRLGEPMSLANVYRNFRRYLDRAGISHSGKGPRVHDFRHTYCVNLLRKWADEEKDLMAYLPYMRTMLGHEGFEETAYYLKLTTERFPYIKDQLKKAFPDLIGEVVVDECEFY